VKGPSARAYVAMATIGAKAILFGGWGSVGFLGDTWEWDGTTWTQRDVRGPPARAYHAMAATNGKVLLFGGQAASSTLGDTWEWDGNVWTEKHPATRPPARWNHAMQ